jgi:hypothetical protein
VDRRRELRFFGIRDYNTDHFNVIIIWNIFHIKGKLHPTNHVGPQGKWRHSSTLSFNFDIHMSVHRDIIPNYSQQDATSLGLFIFTDALHVSGGFSAHRQEHISVHTASGIVKQYCC